MSREEGLRLTQEFDGKRPAALDVFLRYLGIGEAEFMELVAPHVVSPHVMPSLADAESNRTNRIPADFEQWSRVVGDRDKDASLD